MALQLDEVRRYLKRELARRAVLFMGAGFSCGARDADGRTIPLGAELAAELFELCFPGEPPDDSVLQDLFHHALRHHRDALDALLRRRLTVDPRSLPDWYQHWLSQPWRRAYTLNVDVIEQTAAQQFALPRPIVTRSALRDEPDPKPAQDALVVVHLNGIVDDGPEGVTFATSQYGRRLATRDRYYTELANDLLESSFVFVGTRLDEAPLWQHLEARGVRQRKADEDEGPRSFLVTTTLDRARRSLLEDFQIEWVCASAEEFAAAIFR